MPTPRPRYLSRITSPINTAPAAHSPPKPNPCSARRMNSCWKFWANAQRKVNTEYHRIVICSIRTRPKRSAKVPENHPPNDEINKVTVPISPASPRDSPHSAMIVGITKLYICTSNASSAQPPKQAPIVRRSLAFNSPNQASIAFLPCRFSRAGRRLHRRLGFLGDLSRLHPPGHNLRSILSMSEMFTPEFQPNVRNPVVVLYLFRARDVGIVYRVRGYISRPLSQVVDIQPKAEAAWFLLISDDCKPISGQPLSERPPDANARRDLGAIAFHNGFSLCGPNRSAHRDAGGSNAILFQHR